jgi:hypothetical protein
MKYVASPDVLAAHLSGEAVLLDLRDKNYYRLNETAAAVWRSIEAGLADGEIVARVAVDFDVSQSDSAAGIERVIAEFVTLGLITPAAAADDQIPARQQT